MFEKYAATENYDTSALNGMLRGELAAVESYNLAIRHVSNCSLRGELNRMLDEHQCAVCEVRRWVRDLHELPASGSGIWGYFTAAVTGLARIGGDCGMVAALKRGECHGEASYRAALGNPDLPDEFRHLVGARLLPNCQAHLERLDRLGKFLNPMEAHPS